MILPSSLKNVVREKSGSYVQVSGPGLFIFFLLLADERSRALVGVEKPTDFKLTVSADHGIGIDGKIHRELAHGGKLVAAGEAPGGDGPEHLVHNLPVNGNARAQIELGPEGGTDLVRFSHLDI